jgi:hypothetical protein
VGADGSAGDLALGDDGADVVFQAVGVQRDLRTVEHPQQFGLAPMQPPQLPIQQDEAGLLGEDPIEAGAQHPGALGIGVVLVGLQIAIEPPDQAADQLHRQAMGALVGCGL